MPHGVAGLDAVLYVLVAVAALYLLGLLVGDGIIMPAP